MLRWAADGGASGPFGVVVLAPDYRELARFDGIERTALELPQELFDRAIGATCLHAYVLADVGGAVAQSRLVTFEIP